MTHVSKRTWLKELTKTSDHGWCEWPEKWSKSNPSIPCITCLKYYSSIPNKKETERFMIHLELQKKKIARRKTQDYIALGNTKKEDFQKSIIDGKYYCYYHRSHSCSCTRDREGLVIHHTSYPHTKHCLEHRSLICECLRKKDGELVKIPQKKTIRHMEDQLSDYCYFHKTWYCECVRDKHGAIISPLTGYPIHRFCSLHRDIECKCERDSSGTITKHIK